MAVTSSEMLHRHPHAPQLGGLTAAMVESALKSPLNGLMAQSTRGALIQANRLQQETKQLIMLLNTQHSLADKRQRALEQWIAEKKEAASERQLSATDETGDSVHKKEDILKLDKVLGEAGKLIQLLVAICHEVVHSEAQVDDSAAQLKVYAAQLQQAQRTHRHNTFAPLLERRAEGTDMQAACDALDPVVELLLRYRDCLGRNLNADDFAEFGIEADSETQELLLGIVNTDEPGTDTQHSEMQEFYRLKSDYEQRVIEHQELLQRKQTEIDTHTQQFQQRVQSFCHDQKNQDKVNAILAEQHEATQACQLKLASVMASILVPSDSPVPSHAALPMFVKDTNNQVIYYFNGSCRDDDSLVAIPSKFVPPQRRDSANFAPAQRQRVKPESFVSLFDACYAATGIPLTQAHRSEELHKADLFLNSPRRGI